MTGGLRGLGLEPGAVVGWFTIDPTKPYLAAHVSRDVATDLALAVRRCYVGDDALNARRREIGRPTSELIAAKLPNAGSTMAGDFGEILVYVFLAARRLPDEAIGPLKWQLKQDRTKPAPHSDVLLFVVPSWPDASDQDVLLCAEVKTKSTNGGSTPIPDAIRDSAKDRISRLSKTLEWLRERALHETIDGATLQMLERFAHASDFPAAHREFSGIAVLSEDLAPAELETIPDPIPAGSALVVLTVPDLQATYTATYTAAAVAAPPTPEAQRPE